MSDDITLEQFQRCLPKSRKNALTQDMVNNINMLLVDQQLRENYRDNLLSYTSVMKEGNFKIQGYIDAVRYVSFKLFGSSNVEAYAKTFPDRFQRLLDNGASDKDISAYVAAYNKTILVNKIFEQTLVPHHILNADLYQKALNTQAELMISAVSEKVRTDAANSILNHLKAPEVAKVELDVNIKEDKSINELRETTMALVEQQKSMIKVGVMDAKQIAHSKLLIEDGEVVEV